jgi:hypothetical protein
MKTTGFSPELSHSGTGETPVPLVYVPTSRFSSSLVTFVAMRVPMRFWSLLGRKASEAAAGNIVATPPAIPRLGRAVARLTMRSCGKRVTHASKSRDSSKENWSLGLLREKDRHNVLDYHIVQ